MRAATPEGKRERYRMGNTSTDGANQVSPEVSLPDEATIEDRLQRRGYIRTYRAVLDDCGPEAALLYGVIEDYAQLSIRNRRACVPNQDDLATALGTALRNVQRYTAKLRETGWIETQKLPNGRVRYTLNQSPKANRQNWREPTATNGGSQPPNMAGANNKPDVASQNKQKENTGTPYWNPYRAELFKLFFQHYPKQEKEEQAKQAWEETIGTALDKENDGSSALWQAIWFGVQWYGNKVRTEKTEAKYIAAPDNWIRGKRWNDAPAHVREGKV